MLFGPYRDYGKRIHMANFKANQPNAKKALKAKRKAAKKAKRRNRK